MNNECLGCREVRGEIEIPGGAIFKDELLFASHLPIPEGETTVYLGALLIQPMRHADGFEDLTENEAQAFGSLTRRVCRSLKGATNAEHIYLYRLGHHTDHLHLWVVPRYPGTPREYWGMKVDEWPGAPKGGAKEIADLCDRVRAELAKE